MLLCRIAVCDTCDADRETLVKTIHKSLQAMPFPFVIREFSTEEALQTAMQGDTFSVLFVNMRVGTASGIEIARRIRSRGDMCPLVFIARSPALVWESYRVNAVHYLQIPVTEADLREVWRRCFTKLLQNELGITLVADRKPQRLAMKNILYVEANNKHCLIHTRDGLLTTRMPIDQLALMLDHPAFCRCHRGYIVNFRHVMRMELDLHMDNGAVVYVRRSETAVIRKRFEQYQAQAEEA